MELESLMNSNKALLNILYSFSAIKIHYYYYLLLLFLAFCGKVKEQEC